MSDKFVLGFFDHLEIILFVVAVFGFILPMSYSIAKRGRKKTQQAVLNQRTILIDSGVVNKIFFVLFFSVFVIVGIIMIYIIINQGKTLSNILVSIFVGLCLCGFPLWMCFDIIKTTIKILTKQYVIVTDKLLDIYYYHNASNDDSADLSGWRLYFQDFFKVYNRDVTIHNIDKISKYQKGDVFYLVFVSGKQKPYVFPSNEYILDPSERDKLKTLEEAKEYIKLKKFNLKAEVYNGKKVINPNTIIHDFFSKDEKITLLFFSICSIFLLIVCIGISFFNLVASMVVLFMFICIVCITIVKIKYLYSIIRKIKRSQYEIKIDEVISVNENLQYSDSNQITSIQFKNYDKIVYTNKKENYNAQIGDSFYLVFVKGETAPIHVYNTKNYMLEK